MQAADQRRDTKTLAAGWVVLLLAAAALLMPLMEDRRGGLLLGALLVVAGFAEMTAAARRRSARLYAVLAATLTIAAGILFLGRPATAFLPALYVIAAWLSARFLLLTLTALAEEEPSTRRWTFIAAATDAVLALLILAGVSIATLIVALFGPTPAMIASFAWVLAASFAAAGLMLLELAVCERDER